MGSHWNKWKEFNRRIRRHRFYSSWLSLTLATLLLCGSLAFYYLANLGNPFFWIFGTAALGILLLLHAGIVRTGRTSPPRPAGQLAAAADHGPPLPAGGS